MLRFRVRMSKQEEVAHCEILSSLEQKVARQQIKYVRDRLCGIIGELLVFWFTNVGIKLHAFLH
jgi:hypothetical protein